MIISVEKKCTERVLQYAVSELIRFIEQYSDASVAENHVDADKRIVLEVCGKLEPHWYSLYGDGTVLTICGGSPSAVLCGVYEALTESGLFFDAAGCWLVGAFSLERLFAVCKDVRPKCRLRGIRQHINFPMDISAYTLKEAKEYIRSVARMRFTAMTFHSYGGQWHSVDPADPTQKAGHFFYGQHHPVHFEDPLISGIVHNRKVFCIPEAEAVYHDEDARAEYAVYWLGEVFNTVKETGMELTLSVELRYDDPERNLVMLNEICRMYPQIDTLELISYESGGDDKIPGLTLETVRTVLSEMFGKKILTEDGELPYMPQEISFQFQGGALAVKRMLDVVASREHLIRPVALRTGLYLTCPETLKTLWPILRGGIPADVTMSVLPSHGAVAVAEMVKTMGLSAEDWQRTMIYSWAEFDGSMYVQQLSTDGLELLTADIEADSVYGVCVNHWRTAENLLTLLYAAETTCCVVDAESYYRRYARLLGIGDTERFAAACNRLAKLDTYVRNSLGNVGFCYVGCWIRKNGVTPTKRYTAERVQHGIDEYMWLRDEWAALLEGVSSTKGIAFLRLMQNRCYASAVHCRCHLELVPIREMYDYLELPPVTEEQCRFVKGAVERAHVHAREYQEIHAKMMPDRGSEGVIVSYYETIPPFLDAVASHFNLTSAVSLEDSFDAPPAPDSVEK